jgi:hypothetical protein
MVKRGVPYYIYRGIDDFNIIYNLHTGNKKITNNFYLLFLRILKKYFDYSINVE